MPLALFRTIDYSTIANTAAVAAGAYLLPNQKDNKGGVWSVNTGQLIGTGVGTTQSADNHLYFDGYPNCRAQKMVVTGTTGTGEVAAFLRVDPVAHTGYESSLNTPFAAWVQAKVTPGVNTQFGNGPLSPVMVAGHKYQVVTEIADEVTRAVINTAIFDMTWPGGSQPADPINYSDPGAVLYHQAFDNTPFQSGIYGLMLESSARVGMVRLYAAPFAASTDNTTSIRTGIAGTTNVQNRQSVYLTGNGYTAGSPGTPTFTGTFAPTAGDAGTAPSIVSQQVLSSTLAVVLVTGGTAQGVYTITDPSASQTVAITLTNSSPAYVTGGSITSKTFLGASASVKSDGVTDDTVAMQRFVDVLMRYGIRGYMEPGDTIIYQPIVQRQPDSPPTTFGHYSAGFYLEGLAGQSYTPGYGSNLVMKGLAQRAVWEISGHYMVESYIKNVGFFGNNVSKDTANAIFAPCTHWTGYQFEKCTFAYANVGVNIDNSAIVAPYSDQGANGESLELLHCALGGRAVCYRNATASGQAYTHRLDRCQGGAENNGGIFAQVGSIAGGGVQLDVRSQSLSMVTGPLPNILLDVTNGIENINFYGGRVENVQTLVRYRPAGYSYTGSIQLDGLTVAGVVASNTSNIIQCVGTGPSSLIIGLKGLCLKTGSLGTGNDGKMHMVFGGPTDHTQVVLDSSNIEYVDAATVTSSNVVARVNRISNNATYTAGTGGTLIADTYVAPLAIAAVPASGQPKDTSPTQAAIAATLAAEATTSVTIADGTKGQRGTLPVTVGGVVYSVTLGTPTLLPADVASALQRQGWF